MRENHPRVLAALDRVHSATSLRTLLRDPPGFVWRYALGFKAPDEHGASLTLDALVFGSLLHDVLRRTTEALGPKGGLLAGKAAIEEAVREAVEEVRVEAEDEGGVPPGLLWCQALETISERAEAALLDDAPVLRGQTSHAEVPFGLVEKDGGSWPWDETAPVVIPGTTVRITGFIDRLDLSAARDEARVVDYKSGKTPTDLALTMLTAAILAAREGASAGACLPGEDAFGRNDLAFALPSGPALYRARKGLALASALAPVAAIWDQP